jgi:hypothetical protein
MCWLNASAAVCARMEYLYHRDDSLGGLRKRQFINFAVLCKNWV